MMGDLKSVYSKIVKKIRYFWSFVYRRRVRFHFPLSILRQYINYSWSLPEGYRLCSPDEHMDLKAVADLLNMDGNFGMWTPGRVKDDIIGLLIAPDAATLVYHKNQLIGFGSTIDCSDSQCKTGLGNWLFIHPDHRGRAGLAHAITFRTTAFFVRENYEKVIGLCEIARPAALYIYLKEGIVPEYDCLYSFYHWWRIMRRLKPLLERAKSKSAGKIH